MNSQYRELSSQLKELLIDESDIMNEKTKEAAKVILTYLEEERTDWVGEWNQFVTTIQSIQQKWEGRYSLDGMAFSFQETVSQDYMSLDFRFSKETVPSPGGWIFKVHLFPRAENNIIFSCFMEIDRTSITSYSQLEKRIEKLFEGDSLWEEIHLFYNL